MAKLPEAYEENTIIGMLPGDVGYTVPWAMWADADRELWINGNYTVYKKSGGTVHMKIRRTLTGVTVFQNTIGEHRYQPGAHSWDDSPAKLSVELA